MFDNSCSFSDQEYMPRLWTSELHKSSSYMTLRKETEHILLTTDKLTFCEVWGVDKINWIVMVTLLDISGTDEGSQAIRSKKWSKSDTSSSEEHAKLFANMSVRSKRYQNQNGDTHFGSAENSLRYLAAQWARCIVPVAITGYRWSDKSTLSGSVLNSLRPLNASCLAPRAHDAARIIP